MNNLSKNSYGFTLVELMLTMAVSGIIVAAIYSAYISQQRTYLAQEQVAEMQQNIRAAMDIMTREIRMAGYNPTGGAGAGITTALVGQISFTQDTNGDGDTTDAGEIIDFGFSAAAVDADRNGIPDTVSNGVPEASPLGRQTGGAGGYQAIAEDIQAIEFRYLDAANVATTTPANVRSVQISILARASKPDRAFANTMTYTPASGATNNWGPYNDNFRRRLLITSIQCRNLGLE
ncbi:MAG: PilW family protein [Desulfoarculaceae bacterium]|nr:PilW family protein [Desulfoarculaceae bacterium]